MESERPAPQGSALCSLCTGSLPPSSSGPAQPSGLGPAKPAHSAASPPLPSPPLPRPSLSPHLQSTSGAEGPTTVIVESGGSQALRCATVRATYSGAGQAGTNRDCAALLGLLSHFRPATALLFGFGVSWALVCAGATAGRLPRSGRRTYGVSVLCVSHTARSACTLLPASLGLALQRVAGRAEAGLFTGKARASQEARGELCCRGREGRTWVEGGDSPSAPHSNTNMCLRTHAREGRPRSFPSRSWPGLEARHSQLKNARVGAQGRGAAGAISCLATRRDPRASLPGSEQRLLGQQAAAPKRRKPRCEHPPTRRPRNGAHDARPRRVPPMRMPTSHPPALGPGQVKLGPGRLCFGQALLQLPSQHKLLQAGQWERADFCGRRPRNTLVPERQPSLCLLPLGEKSCGEGMHSVHAQQAPPTAVAPAARPSPAAAKASSP